MPIEILAEGEVVAPDYQAFLTALESTFTAAKLSEILVAGVSAVAGIVLFWWAVRKVGRMFIRAFEKGKLRI